MLKWGINYVQIVSLLFGNEDYFSWCPCLPTPSPNPPIPPPPKAEKVTAFGKYSRNIWLTDLGKDTIVVTLEGVKQIFCQGNIASSLNTSDRDVCKSPDWHLPSFVDSSGNFSHVCSDAAFTGAQLFFLANGSCCQLMVLQVSFSSFLCWASLCPSLPKCNQRNPIWCRLSVFLYNLY